MAKEKKELTPEQKESLRYIALQNLGEDKLSGIAAAFYAYKNNAYGKDGNADMHEFIYGPAIDSGVKFYNPETGEEAGLISYLLKESGEEDELYSGTLTEKNILKKSAGIIGGATQFIKVSDLMNLIGSKETLDSKYAGRYMFELAQSENEEDKQLHGALTSNYMRYMTKKYVAQASEEGMKAIKGGLEAILKPRDKGENKDKE